MLRITWATLKRILGDGKVAFPLLVIPIIIILIFSALSLDANQAVKPKLAVFLLEAPKSAERADSANIAESADGDHGTQAALANLKHHYTLFKVKAESDMISRVRSGSVVAGITLKGDQVTKVIATNSQLGAIIQGQIQTQIQGSPAPADAADAAAPSADPNPAKSKASAVRSVTAFLINYMMFSLIFIATEIISLKNNGVMRRMIAMPLTEKQVFGGHVLAFVILLTGQVAIVHLAIQLLFGVSMVANLPLGLCIMGAMVFVILSLGVLLTRFTENPSLLPVFANLIMVPLMMVSGTFMKIEGNVIFDTLRYISPQYWVYEGYNLLNRGSLAVGPHIAVLLVMGITLFSLATAGNKKLIY